MSRLWQLRPRLPGLPKGLDMPNNITTFALPVGTVFFNTADEPKFPGVPQFKKGYYEVVEIRDGFFTQKLKPQHRKVYEIRRCTKDGSKLLKYSNAWSCYKFDEWLAINRLVIPWEFSTPN